MSRYSVSWIIRIDLEKRYGEKINYIMLLNKLYYLNSLYFPLEYTYITPINPNHAIKYSLKNQPRPEYRINCCPSGDDLESLLRKKVKIRIVNLT